MEMLDQAEIKVRGVVATGEFRNKVLLLQDQIQDVRNRLDNVVKVENPTVIADLSTKRTTASAIGILPLDELIYAYEYNALYPIILDKLQDPLTVDQNESVIDGVFSPEDKSLIFLTKANKVIEFKDNFVKFLDTSDPAWKSGMALQVYGDRLYVLDPTENKIWRYRRGKESYSVAESYSAQGDVTNAVDFAVDGSIYVLNSDGSIVKYYAGELEEGFAVLRSPMVPLTKPTRIFTEFEFNQVYVVEPSTYRVLTYNKDAKTGNLVYSHQYQFDASAGILKDVYVDKESNKMFIATDTKVYQVDL